MRSPDKKSYIVLVIAAILIVLFCYTSKAQERIEIPSQGGEIIDTSIEIKYKTKIGLLIENIFSPPQLVFNTDTIIYNGASKINIAFLADGYTIYQQIKFTNDVKKIWSDFLKEPLFASKSTAFNVYAINVISQDSGAIHPATATDEYTSGGQPIANPSTYFSSSFDYGGIHRLLVARNTAGILSVLQNNCPNYNAAFVVVNSPYFGGSGGTYAVASTHALSSRIMIHESGHSFVGLRDEYGGSIYCGVIGINADSAKNAGKWLGFSGAGYYPPANYCNSQGSPFPACIMRSLNSPFDAVCYDAYKKKIETFVPLVTCTAPTFTVTATRLRIKFIWTMQDGVIYKIQFRLLGTTVWATRTGVTSPRAVNVDSKKIYEVRMIAVCEGKVYQSPIKQIKTP